MVPTRVESNRTERRPTEEPQVAVCVPASLSTGTPLIESDQQLFPSKVNLLLPYRRDPTYGRVLSGHTRVREGRTVS